MENHEPPAQKKSRAEQARLNGAKSKGPVTEAGRTRSWQGPRKHGRYARSEAKGVSFLLRNEDPEQFALFRQGWLALFDPQCDAEQEFLDGFISNEWRLIRSQAAETALLNEEMRQRKAAVDPGIQHLSAGVREQTRLGLAVAGAYTNSRAAEALDRKINHLQNARLSTLQAWALVRAHVTRAQGRTQESVDSK